MDVVAVIYNEEKERVSVPCSSITDANAVAEAMELTPGREAVVAIRVPQVHGSGSYLIDLQTMEDIIRRFQAEKIDIGSVPQKRKTLKKRFSNDEETEGESLGSFPTPSQGGSKPRW